MVSEEKVELRADPVGFPQKSRPTSSLVAQIALQVIGCEPGHSRQVVLLGDLGRQTEPHRPPAVAGADVDAGADVVRDCSLAVSAPSTVAGPDLWTSVPTSVPKCSRPRPRGSTQLSKNLGYLLLLEGFTILPEEGLEPSRG